MRLSIITINFNNVIGLQKTIESVLCQTYSDYEWIVIDGCSTDESIELLKQYYNKFSYQISEPDNGIYHAMNKGIVRAKGEYCFFLNSGDYLVSSSVLEAVFSENPTENVLFGNLVICLNEKIVGTIKGKKMLTFLDLYKSDVVKHQSAFIKRSLFEKFGFYNEDLRILADWEFFLRTIGLARTDYRYINVDIAYFDNNGLSIRGVLQKRNDNKYLKIMYLL